MHDPLLCSRGYSEATEELLKRREVRFETARVRGCLKQKLDGDSQRTEEGAEVRAALCVFRSDYARSGGLTRGWPMVSSGRHESLVLLRDSPACRRRLLSCAGGEASAAARCPRVARACGVDDSCSTAGSPPETPDDEYDYRHMSGHTTDLRSAFQVALVRAGYTVVVDRRGSVIWWRRSRRRGLTTAPVWPR